MSNLSQFLGGKIKKSQVITATGTFSPSSTLIASGGWVDAFVVGGGAGGVNYYDAYGTQYYGGGGGGVCTSTIQLSTTQTINVTIGGGGAVNNTNVTNVANNGGFTSVHWTSAVTGTVGTTGGTTLTASATNSIATKSFILIDSEIMYVSAGGGTTSLTVVRGALGSVAATHTTATIYIIGAASGGGQGSNSGIDYLSGVSYSGKSFEISSTDLTGYYYGYHGGGAGGAASPPSYSYGNQLGPFSGYYYYPYNMLPGGPGPGISGFGAGGNGNVNSLPNMYTAIVSTTSANSGAGGGYTVAGKSGIVILTWFE